MPRESLIGVSVTVKGKEGVGTITDVDGNYSIVCSAQDVLVFSYVGYATQEIAVKNQKQLNVVLKEDTKVLDEVIVIGYGTTTCKGLRPTWLSSSAVAILMIVRLTLIFVVSAL